MILWILVENWNFKWRISWWTPNSPLPTWGSIWGGQLSGSVSNPIYSQQFSFHVTSNFTPIHMYPALMTDYYGAFSTSTSDFPGQIQSTIINTSYERILTCLCNISKMSASVSSGFQTRENWWKHEAAGQVLLLISSVWNPDETKHEFLKLLLQQKKISLNYHLNKFSQFNYYIWDVKYAWTSKKYVWCVWSYHLIGPCRLKAGFH